jgi:hypothetical protein
MQTQLPAVEGITPDILWYTIVGLVGIGALILLVDKVAEVFRKAKERRDIQRQPTDELAERISQKVTEDLEPRFDEINRKLANDKLLIDDHTAKLAAHNQRVKTIEDGNKVLCRGILALLSHEINGNSDDKLKASQAEITNYLIDK